jgi:hypothetical protein
VLQVQTRVAGAWFWFQRLERQHDQLLLRFASSNSNLAFNFNLRPYMKMIGWGKDDKGGFYWIIVNSWLNW